MAAGTLVETGNGKAEGRANPGAQRQRDGHRQAGFGGWPEETAAPRGHAPAILSGAYALLDGALDDRIDVGGGRRGGGRPGPGATRASRCRDAERLALPAQLLGSFAPAAVSQLPLGSFTLRALPLDLRPALALDPLPLPALPPQPLGQRLASAVKLGDRRRFALELGDCDLLARGLRRSRGRLRIGLPNRLQRGRPGRGASGGGLGIALRSRLNRGGRPCGMGGRPRLGEGPLDPSRRRTPAALLP